jgi:thiamine monophosphate synthase
VAGGDADAAGDADGDGVELGSVAIAVTHTEAISANKTRVAVITHHRTDELSRNVANVPHSY